MEYHQLIVAVQKHQSIPKGKITSIKMRTIIIVLLASMCFLSVHSQNTTSQDQSKDSLKIKLKILFMKDQFFRKMYKDVEEQYGSTSHETEYFWEVVEKQDQILEKELIAILEQYGWLGITEVGRLGNTAQWAILQHASVATKQKYAPLLKASVLEKESQPQHYARLIDRMLINQGEAQRYGSQITYDAGGNKIFYEIQEPGSINQRRAAIGLSSIQDFAKKMGVEWKVN